ncbi:MAG: hypothetical protein ACP5VE_00860 [Chthonomonadales bacterium]
MLRRALLAGSAPFLLMGLWGCATMAVSPDGRRVAATSAHGLAILDDRGRVLRTVPQSDHADAVLWSPDGRYLLFFKSGDQKQGTSEREAAETAVLYDTATNQLKVISRSASDVGAFRSDGRKVALFELDEGGQVALVERDIPSGEETARYYSSAVNVSGPGMQWLPGRDAQAYLATGADRTRHGASDLYVMMDGEEQVLCPCDDVIGFAPTADGKGLIWARSPRNGRPAPLILETYDFASQTRTPVPMKRMPFWLTASEGYRAEVVYAAFSPDTRRLAVCVDYEERRHPSWRKARTFSACFVMTRDGTQWRLLRRTVPRNVDGGVVILPQWARNGSRIAVMLLGQYTYTVSLFEPDGSRERRLLAVIEWPRYRARRHRGRR